MALKKGEIQKWFMVGFWAAIATGFILRFISRIVSAIPGVSLDLQAITAGTTGLGGIISPEVGNKLFGLVPGIANLSIPQILMVGLGGGVFVIMGAYLVDAVKALQFTKTKQGKLATVLVVAAIASGWLLSMTIGIPAIGAIIALSVDAYVLSFILIGVDDAIKTKIVP